jgi:hypothetical protein
VEIAFATHFNNCSQANWFTQSLYLSNDIRRFGVMLLDVKLFVDGKEITLNEFVIKMLSGTLVGAVTSLRGIERDWKEINVKVTK